MGYKTKIDWCDSSWNPVTGCNHGCKYCYARRIAERFSTAMAMPDFELLVPVDEPHPVYELSEPVRHDFHGNKREPYPYGFQPTFHRYKLDEPQHWKKPRTIFVCSMGDMFGNWVPDEWIKQLFEACEAAPQHRFLFLTKNPADIAILNAPESCPKEITSGLERRSIIPTGPAMTGRMRYLAGRRPLPCTARWCMTLAIFTTLLILRRIAL